MVDIMFDGATRQLQLGENTGLAQQAAAAAAASASSVSAAATSIATIPLAFTPQTGTFEAGKYYSASTGLGVTSSTRDSRTLACNGGDWFLVTGQVLGTAMADRKSVV